MVRRSDSPPWPRRGGRDIKKDAAKPPLMERTGRFVQLPIHRSLERTFFDAARFRASAARPSAPGCGGFASYLSPAQPPRLGQGGEPPTRAILNSFRPSVTKHCCL